MSSSAVRRRSARVAGKGDEGPVGGDDEAEVGGGADLTLA